MSSTRPGPQLTVVVPTYRRPEMLEVCLRALQAQTFRDFVVLVCDNSEAHEGDAVVAGLADPRFLYRGRPRDLGILRNVMAGFREASTAYVMEVDDDDVLYADALDVLMTPLLADPELVVSFADMDVVDGRGRVLTGRERTEFAPAPHLIGGGVHRPFTALAVKGMVYMVSTVLRRDAVDWDAVPVRCATAYDRHLGLAAARGGRPAHFVDRPVVAYRVHPGGDGIRHESRQLTGALAALTAERPHLAPDDRRVLEHEIVRVRFMLARALLHEGRPVRGALQVARLCLPATASTLVRLVAAQTWHRGNPVGRSASRRRELLS